MKKKPKEIDKIDVRVILAYVALESVLIKIYQAVVGPEDLLSLQPLLMLHQTTLGITISLSELLTISNEWNKGLKPYRDSTTFGNLGQNQAWFDNAVLLFEKECQTTNSSGGQTNNLLFSTVLAALKKANNSMIDLIDNKYHINQVGNWSVDYTARDGFYILLMTDLASRKIVCCAVLSQKPSPQDIISFYEKASKKAGYRPDLIHSDQEHCFSNLEVMGYLSGNNIKQSFGKGQFKNQVSENLNKVVLTNTGYKSTGDWQQKTLADVELLIQKAVEQNNLTIKSGFLQNFTPDHVYTGSLLVPPKENLMVGKDSPDVLIVGAHTLIAGTRGIVQEMLEECRPYILANDPTKVVELEELLKESIPMGSNADTKILKDFSEKLNGAFQIMINTLQTATLSLGNVQQNQNMTIELLRDMIHRQQEQQTKLSKKLDQKFDSITQQLALLTTAITQVNKKQTTFKKSISLKQFKIVMAKIPNPKHRLAVGLKITTGLSTNTIYLLKVQNLSEFKLHKTTKIVKVTNPGTSQSFKMAQQVQIDCLREFKSYWKETPLNDFDTVTQNKQSIDPAWGMSNKSFIRLVNSTIKKHFGTDFFNNKCRIKVPKKN